MENEKIKEELLWETARRRAAFKRSLISYFAVNAFLVAIWYFTSGSHSYFWPVWPLLGWDFGILMQYTGAYHGSNLISAEREYEKLKQRL